MAVMVYLKVSGVFCLFCVLLLWKVTLQCCFERRPHCWGWLFFSVFDACSWAQMWAMSSWRGLLSRTGDCMSKAEHQAAHTPSGINLGSAAFGRGSFWEGTNAPWLQVWTLELGLIPRQGKEWSSHWHYLIQFLFSPSFAQRPWHGELSLELGWKRRGWHQRKTSWGKPSFSFFLKSLLCSYPETRDHQYCWLKVKHLICLGLVGGVRYEIESFSFVLDNFPYNSRMPSESDAKIASLPLPHTVFISQNLYTILSSVLIANYCCPVASGSFLLVSSCEGGWKGQESWVQDLCSPITCLLFLEFWQKCLNSGDTGTCISVKTNLSWYLTSQQRR